MCEEHASQGLGYLVYLTAGKKRKERRVRVWGDVKTRCKLQHAKLPINQLFYRPHTHRITEDSLCLGRFSLF